MKNTKTAIKQLQVLANKAASGHWYEVGELCYHDCRAGEIHILHPNEDEYTAAVSPEAVLVLLDDVAKLAEALEELVELVEDYRQGEYIIDSFTTQPARIVLAAYHKGSA